MICSYCGRESRTSVCNRCRNEMNSILNYNDKCCRLNDLYALFGALNFIVFLVALISTICFLFSFASAKIPSAFSMSITSAISTTLFIFITGIRDKYENKISDFIETEMRERHGR